MGEPCCVACLIIESKQTKRYYYTAYPTATIIIRASSTPSILPLENRETSASWYKILQASHYHRRKDRENPNQRFSQNYPQPNIGQRALASLLYSTYIMINLIFHNIVTTGSVFVGLGCFVGYRVSH